MTKRLYSWLLVIVLCVVPLNAFSQSNKLGKEAIIQIAINKAKELGYKTADMNILYDEGNKGIGGHCEHIGESVYNKKTNAWDKVLPSTPEKEYPALAGKDYQAVYFGPKQIQKGGDLWVFIDKDTGNVIQHVGGE